MVAQSQTASSASGRGVLNISDLPTDSSSSRWWISDLPVASGTPSRNTGQPSGRTSSPTNGVVPSLSVISSDALRTRSLKTYTSALKQSLAVCAIPPHRPPLHLELNMDARPALVTPGLSLAHYPSEGDLQQFYDFLSLDLSSLVELSLVTRPLTLSDLADAVRVLPLLIPEDLEYMQLTSSARRISSSGLRTSLAHPPKSHACAHRQVDAAAGIIDRLHMQPVRRRPAGSRDFRETAHSL